METAVAENAIAVQKSIRNLVIRGVLGTVLVGHIGVNAFVAIKQKQFLVRA
jgi:predicted sulfurtransferase